MDEYLVSLILAYFKTHTEEYSMAELNGTIGVPFTQFMELIDTVIAEGLLAYADDKLTLTFKGRMKLMNSSLENYSESDCIDNIFFHKKWDINTPYFVHGFSKKKWRDS